MNMKEDWEERATMQRNIRKDFWTLRITRLQQFISQYKAILLQYEVQLVFVAVAIIGYIML